MTTALKPGRTRAATLTDVAALAGVVPMTASRAINATGYVSAEVRERVLKAARKLRYRPNMLARQLRGGALHAVGVILPDIANPFSAELMRGINDVFDPAGYVCFIGTADDSVARERSAMQGFVDHRIDGLIVATHNTAIGDDALRSIAQQGVPVVTIGRPVKLAHVDCVIADDYQGAHDVTTHLIAVGHKRIGFLGCSLEDGDSLPRFRGFADAMKAAGLAVAPEHAVGGVAAPGFATENDGFRGLMDLAKRPRRPTAVLSRNDSAALGALRAAYLLGLRVPQDIAIAGFDNIPSAAFQTPPLTTVAQPIQEQGQAAARLLLQRIQGDHDAPATTVRMACRLVVRQSTDLTASDPHAIAPKKAHSL